MTDLIKVEELTAGDLLQYFELSEVDAEKHVIPDTAPEISIEKLATAGFHFDAVKLLAHGLPKRLAVWWACLASRAVQTSETSQENVAALLSAEAWAKTPTEENRLRCKTLGEATRFETAASWAATSAAWSAGSMAQEGEPDVAPPQHLYAHAVAGSIALAASLDNPDSSIEKFSTFLAQGLDLARGGDGRV